MHGGVTYVPRKPHIMIASSVALLSAAIEVQTPSVALSTILKSSTELINDFRGKKCSFTRSVIPRNRICRGCIRGVLLYPVTLK